jgi:hypothetical protein
MNNKNEYQSAAKQNRFSAVCLNSCRNLLASIERIKQGIFKEFGSGLSGSETVLRGALNEAEAMAWQTAFPHLVFPELAQEKAAEAARWARRQQEVWSGGLEVAFAA